MGSMHQHRHALLPGTLCEFVSPHLDSIALQQSEYKCVTWSFTLLQIISKTKMLLNGERFILHLSAKEV